MKGPVRPDTVHGSSMVNKCGRNERGSLGK